MASNATISRYRPALCVLAALAAGYTIYYVHTTQQASNITQEPARTIHRQRANNRRRARPPQIEELAQARAQELTAYSDYQKTSCDPESLIEAWEACPDDLGESYLLQQKYWPNQDVPATLPLRKTPPTLSSLRRDFGVSTEDAKTILQDYEEALFRTFVCQRVPPKCVLEDDRGLDHFVEVFSMIDRFEFPHIFKFVIQLFNAGAYDRLGTRRETYERFRVRPPGIETIPSLASAEQQAGHETEPFTSQALDATTDEEDNASQSADSWNEDETDDTKKEGAQPLLNMLFHIAEDQARREGFVHSGIRCQNCHTGPIRGFRYKCINCIDFDLCEVCETMQIHPKTHLFLKIKVPTPAHAISRRPQAPWYPGKATGVPKNLKSQHNKLLSEESGFTEHKIDALWEQFKNLAATPWADDPLGFGWAIDQTTFYKSFSLNKSPVTQKAPVSLIYDRIFRLHDSNKDGLIGFEEFVHGMAVLRSKNVSKRMRKTFEGFDFDEDGFISRKEVLAIFKACYALSQELARDLFAEFEVELMEGGNLRENILGTQPLSAAFTGPFGNPTIHQLAGHGKVRNANGDLVISDSGGITLDDDQKPDLAEIIGDLKEIAVHGNLKNSSDEGLDGTVSSSEMSGHEDLDETGESITSEDPAQIGDTDADNDLSRQLTNQTDNTPGDRRWVLYEDTSQGSSSHSGSNRETTRQNALTDRISRKQFYDDETYKTLAEIEHGSELPQSGDQDNSVSPRETTAEVDVPIRDKDVARPANTRVPPPMSQTRRQDDSGSTRENASVGHDSDLPQSGDQDDFISTRQTTADVSVPISDKDVSHPANTRVPPPMPPNLGQETLFQITQECINELIDPLFRSREDLTLCFEHFKTYLGLCEQHLEVDATSMMRRDLHSGLFKQAMNLLSSFQLQHYLKVRAASIKSYGHGDDHPLIGYLQTLDDVNSLNHKEVAAEELQIVLRLRNGQENLDETQPTPSLGSDASQPEESESEYPAMVHELHESINLFDQNDNTTLEDDISKQSLNSLLEESGYSILQDMTVLSVSQSSEASTPDRDPTLPQNRPNSISPPITDNRVSLPKPFNPDGVQYIPAVSDKWSDEFTSFLRFLHVLQRAHEDDQQRGGPGKIDFKEFSDVVTGSSARDLDFLGQWIDM